MLCRALLLCSSTAALCVLSHAAHDAVQVYQEKEADKKMKQKARERMQPKMGKLDIDYQASHDLE